MTPLPHIVLNQPEPPSEPVPVSEEDIQKILGEITAREHVQFRSVEVVFMSPEEIIEINKKYLNHDYVTDIITFRLDDPVGDQDLPGDEEQLEDEKHRAGGEQLEDEEHRAGGEQPANEEHRAGGEQPVNEENPVVKTSSAGNDPSGGREKSRFGHGNHDGKASVNESIEGTLCCCDHQIRKQSKELKTGEREEFLRVVIHGMLHLCGWEDETAEQRAAMRARENVYLGLMDTV